MDLLEGASVKRLTRFISYSALICPFLAWINYTVYKDLCLIFRLFWKQCYMVQTINWYTVWKRWSWQVIALVFVQCLAVMGKKYSQSIILWNFVCQYYIDTRTPNINILLNILKYNQDSSYSPLGGELSALVWLGLTAITQRETVRGLQIINNLSYL